MHYDMVDTPSNAWSCVVVSICLILFVIVAIFLGWYGSKQDKAARAKWGNYVGRFAEFTLDGDKLVRGKVVNQKEDSLGIEWVNRRGEIRVTYKTINKVSIIEE